MPTGQDLRDRYRELMSTRDTTGTWTTPTYSFSYEDATAPIEPPKPPKRPEVTLENRHKWFDTKFGVELEFEMEGYEPLENIFGALKLMGLDVDDVKSDGSLSEEGFEVLSKPQPTLWDLYYFMGNTLDVLKERYPIYDYSPTAVHIHVSNIPEPTNLFYLVSYFADVFEHLRVQNRNDLMHNRLAMPSYSTGAKLSKHKLKHGYETVGTVEMLQSVERGIDPIYRREASECGQKFMRGRRSTLRYAGWDGNVPTMEFRIFPQRLNKKVYRAYIKIVNGLLKYSQERSTWKVYQLIKAHRRGEKPLYIKLKEFMDMCDLNTDEMYMMFHDEDYTNGFSTQKLPFHVLCMCEEAKTEISDNHNYMFQQYQELALESGDRPVIYGKFVDVHLTSFNRGRATLIVESGSRVHEYRQMRITDRDLRWAVEYEDVWFSLTHSSTAVPMYIPRCLVSTRSSGSSEMAVADHLGGDRVIKMERSIFDMIVNMWNRSMQWCSSTEGREIMRARHGRQQERGNDPVRPQELRYRRAPSIPLNVETSDSATLDELIEELGDRLSR